ncbi:UDP-2-acetamido-2-deoxy-ribo-hexuluronate aminotransferase [Kitasatospora sp. GP30]|uniref:DegT/DnrJ/EryC1/StrS family aminotransferase n=1 Tax=Kitasatospora sp. GP30 TaxID=3035084 RepID=UPI000CC39601|nr:DegT/DnrJ/EryC1/StrS family aminotransferase [Kitasatospora sp. GP30]MDH6138152.1 UDP-2-acetamido-2-deoxy-ribo-hexuluronate aminotransferase [Kitasatospora sp. GP30]
MQSSTANPGALPRQPAGRRPVPFFTQARTFEELWPLIERRAVEVLDDGKFSHGHQVAQLERALAEYTGARHVVGVNSGTDALVLLLRAAGLRPGDEVVVPAFSFVASASSVVLAGGRPVFADIDPQTYALDPAALEAAVTERTRFVMPVHLFHRLADLPALCAAAGRHGLTVVEDSAEAIGMRLGGRHAGLFGAGGVLSFFPTKTLGAIGDAGAVLTDDDGIAATAAALRHHGRFGRTIGDFSTINTGSTLPGCNSKMDDLQAAVLLAKLTRLDADIARRAELAAAYDERLAGVPGVLRRPPVGGIEGQVFYVYLIETARRDELAAHLALHGVETEIYYPLPLPLQPCFAELGHRAGEFPVAEAACTRTLALPLYPELELDQVDTVCELIRTFPWKPMNTAHRENE